MSINDCKHTDGKQLQLAFGIMEDPLSVQIEKSGFEINSEIKTAIDKMNDAINFLFLQSILTDKETASARKKLMKQIIKAIKGEIYR